MKYAPDHTVDRKETGDVDFKPEEEVDTQCGYGSCKPGFLQKFNNPKVLLAAMCIFTFSQGNQQTPLALYMLVFFMFLSSVENLKMTFPPK